MIFKILGSLIVVGATTVIGFLVAGSYYKRVHQIRDLQYALGMLESEIIHTATPLIQAFSIVSEKIDEPIKSLFYQIALILKDKKTESVAEGFSQAYKINQKELLLEKEEIQMLEAFMQSLGSSDIEGQKKNFNITIKKLEAFEKKAEEIRVKNEKLYKYLGVCAGALIVILLV